MRRGALAPHGTAAIVARANDPGIVRNDPVHAERDDPVELGGIVHRPREHRGPRARQRVDGRRRDDEVVQRRRVGLRARAASRAIRNGSATPQRRERPREHGRRAARARSTRAGRPDTRARSQAGLERAARSAATPGRASTRAPARRPPQRRRRPRPRLRACLQIQEDDRVAGERERVVQRGRAGPRAPGASARARAARRPRARPAPPRRGRRRARPRSPPACSAARARRSAVADPEEAAVRRARRSRRRGRQVGPPRARRRGRRSPRSSGRSATRPARGRP